MTKRIVVYCDNCGSRRSILSLPVLVECRTDQGHEGGTVETWHVLDLCSWCWVAACEELVARLSFDERLAWVKDHTGKRKGPA